MGTPTARIKAWSPGDFREEVIKPALKALALPNWEHDSSEDLLLGTALQESGLRNIKQEGGPALGVFQMEPATHEDIWDTYLVSRKNLATAVRAIVKPSVPSVAEIMANPVYAAALCRIKYLRSPKQLPVVGDVPGLARMWKEVYNTPLGKGTEDEFVKNWLAALGPNWVKDPTQNADGSGSSIDQEMST